MKLLGKIAQTTSILAKRGTIRKAAADPRLVDQLFYSIMTLLQSIARPSATEHEQIQATHQNLPAPRPRRLPENLQVVVEYTHYDRRNMDE